MSQPLVADSAPAGAGELWTLFSTAVAGKPDELADFFLLPPSAGSAAQVAGASEEVRFLRDETANLVWAVEETTRTGSASRGPGASATRHAAPPGASARR